MIEWNPTVSGVADHAKNYGKIPLILTPYCKAPALKDLISRQATADKFDLVVRFTAREISQGATDLEVYDLLSKHGYKLYAHPSIHLKLYVYGPETAFLTSANLTKRGLGDGKCRNVETGTLVSLSSVDWVQINGILDESRLVTPDLVEQLKKYQGNPDKLEELLDDFYSEKGLSMLDLPSLNKPEDFIQAFMGNLTLTGDDLQRYLSDYATYRADQFDADEDPTEKLGAAFLSKPFIKAFGSHLQKNQSMRFGAVTQWFHNNISERPLPYRSEIKEMVSSIYNWVTFFKEEASWSVPGEHSQVIQWTEGEAASRVQNPPWSHEELILAIEVFMQIEETGEEISQTNPRIIALSQKLNELDIHPIAARGLNFRDPDGVRARVSYFKRISGGIIPNDRPNYLRAWEDYQNINH